MRRVSRSRAALVLVWVTVISTVVAVAATIGLAATRGERTRAPQSVTTTTVAPAALSERCRAALDDIEGFLEEHPDGPEVLDDSERGRFFSLSGAAYGACEPAEMTYINQAVVAPWASGR